MTDEALETNTFYTFLQEQHGGQLEGWCVPHWLVCVPHQDVLNHLTLSSSIIEAHALRQISSDGRYVSALGGGGGGGLVYEVGGEEPRAVVATREEDEGEEGTVHVTKATVLKEYLLTRKDKVIHILLIDQLLNTFMDLDQQLTSRFLSTGICSPSQAENFLEGLMCHGAVLGEVGQWVATMAAKLEPGQDVGRLQHLLQDLLLEAWEALLRRHPQPRQALQPFQDLLFRALDYWVGARLHAGLWWLVEDRCGTVDHLVRARLSHLRMAKLSSLQLAIPPSFYTPLPAAVVELASLDGVEGGVGRLQIIHDTIELIQAQAKEARLNLHQYHDEEGEPELVLSREELVGLLATVVVQAQTPHLVSNLYYMTHFTFSVTQDNPLWVSLGLLRGALETLMKLDMTPPTTPPLRKDLSLQHLLQVSAEVESGGKGSASTGDITALDLQLHQISQQIQLSTQALAQAPPLPPPQPQDGSRGHSFREFLASIPSSLRESLRRRQSQQRSAIQSSLSG